MALGLIVRQLVPFKTTDSAAPCVAAVPAGVKVPLLLRVSIETEAPFSFGTKAKWPEGIDGNAEGFESCRDRGNQGQGPIRGADSEHRDGVVQPIHHIGEFAGRINGH